MLCTYSFGFVKWTCIVIRSTVTAAATGGLVSVNVKILSYVCCEMDKFPTFCDRHFNMLNIWQWHSVDIFSK